MLKRDKVVAFSTSREFLRRGNPDYFPYSYSGPPNMISMTLPEFMKGIQNYKYPDQDYFGDSISTYVVKNIQFPIDLVKLKKLINQENLVPTIDIQLKQYITLSDFLALDLAYNNIHTRPVYFTEIPDLFEKKYLQREGLVYRLLPLKETNAKIEIAKIESYLSVNPGPILLEFTDEDGNYKEDELRSRSDLYEKVIAYYLSINDQKKADYWAANYLAGFEPGPVRHSIGDITVAAILLKTSSRKKGAEMIRNIAVNMMRDYRKGSSLASFQNKEGLKETLDYLLELLSSNNLSTVTVSAFLAELEKEGN
jgi:hypothetical protein